MLRLTSVPSISGILVRVSSCIMYCVVVPCFRCSFAGLDNDEFGPKLVPCEGTVGPASPRSCLELSTYAWPSALE